MKTHHYTSPITATTTTSAGNTNGKRFSRPFSRREGVGAGIFLRRGVRYLLLVSLLYMSALIICMGPFSFLMRPRPLPGSVYRSHEIFLKLWDDIQADNSSKIEISTLWRYKRKLKEQKPCPRTSRRKLGYSRRGYYLIVEANGGLNQQRSSICNAVAVAALLNAILVIPHFEVHSVWNDPSQFSDIYDAEHFINTVKPYVKVVRRLPPEWMEVYDFNISNIPYYRVPAWSTTQYYLDIVQPVLNKKRVMRIAPFANRLAMNVPPNIQFLRCLSNYEALRFSSAISILSKKLITQMIDKSSHTGGKYISVHLRFEEDMVAFSCCEYDGGRAEKIQMDSIRQKGWGEKFKRKADVIEPGLNRINGRCPMTPLEVGMMLRGMGFANDTPIYLAAGTIYQAGKNLAPLLKMFPLLQTKESLAVPEELAPFKDYSSRMAALDYMVCLASEVFVTTQGGNFPHFLMGHRRFIYGGHAKTVKPDKSQLAFLLRDTNISWTAFKNQMEVMLAESDRKGKLVISGGKKSNRKNSIFSNPFPECSCLMEMKNLTFKQTHTFYQNESLHW